MAQTKAYRSILFARIGWAKFYGCCGAQAEDLIGGGSYNETARGAEYLNFAETEGRLFGYVASPKKRIEISKLGEVGTPGNGDFVSEVLVIFFAKSPDGNQCIVGWYNHAKVFRRLHKRGKDGPPYNLRCRVESAVLLPVEKRKELVPHARKGKPGTGTANTMFVEKAAGRHTRWQKRCINFVKSYKGVNLLDCQPSTDTDNVTNELIKSGGFEPDQEKRTAIDEYAMKLATEKYEKLGYKVDDVHYSESYDLHASKGSKDFLIEVKGTRGDGSSFILTEAEVQLSLEPKNNCELCVVHSIRLQDGFPARGGEVVITAPWRVSAHELVPIGYKCTLRSSAAVQAGGKAKK